MEIALLLSGWLLVSALACRWPGRLPGPGGVLVLVLATLLVSPFWRSLLWAWLGREPLPLGGIDAAYLSLWALVLIPILRRDLSVAALRANLASGVVAAAAFGLAMDALPLALLGLGSGMRSEIIAGGIHAALGLSGLGLRLALRHPQAHFPWEYPAWYLGLLAMSLDRPAG